MLLFVDALGATQSNTGAENSPRGAGLTVDCWPCFARGGGCSSEFAVIDSF